MATQVKTFCIEDQVARLTQNILRPQSAWVSVVIRMQKVQLGGPSSTLGLRLRLLASPLREQPKKQARSFSTSSTILY